MNEHRQLVSIARFCGKCDCGCPELFLDHAAAPERRVVITDDFGQCIAMSMTQLDDLVADVKAGRLDALVGTP
ncbi:MAG: hypothetical protein DLM55_03310 [Acidimicrobiales bacterium]|nr:MAG: hypothetical protein DLM55_03310 [Acidimicrobiales bacterium]